MSRRNLSIVGILVLMGITSVVSVLAYTFFVGGSGEASQPISAPTLSLEEPTANPADAQIAALSTQVAELTSQNATLVAAAANAGSNLSPTAEATSEATVEATSAEATVETAAASEPTLFRIVPEESQVRFILTEDLRGTPTVVTGITNQVAGDILIDFNAPANSRVGIIRINARTLTTDSEFRNRALRAEILQSSNDAFEFAQFTPTAVTGLPASVAVGEEVTFQITGDLTVRDITNPVTFDVTATVTPEDRLEGSASAQVTRAAYDLQIPNAPGVANVSDEVQLEIDFVATQVDQ